MSITGILSSVLFGSGAASNAQSAQSKFHKIQQEFQQVGKDLQSGNLSAAQADFATLQKDVPQGTTSTTSTTSTTGAASGAAAGTGSSAIAQEFKQLSQDLQSGNLPAAQADYATLQQNFQSQATQGHGHHHHASGDSGGNANGGNASGSNFGQSQISQLFAQLGQSLQAGNATAAQQAYSTLQNDLTQFAETNGLTATPPGATLSSSGSVSVSA